MMPTAYVCYNAHKSYLCNSINIVISANEQYSHLFSYKKQNLDTQPYYQLYLVFLAIYRKYTFILLPPTHSAGPCFETMVSLIFAEALVQQALGESYWAGAPVALEITQQEYGAKY